MPILVLLRPGQEENAYGRFTGEILRAEGWNGFQLVELPDPFRREDIPPADLLILTRCVLRASEIEALLGCVRDGGNLIAFRPAYALAEAFGLVPTYTVTFPPYIGIDRGSRTGGGLTGEPLQAHLPADNFRIEGVDPTPQVAAWLCDGDGRLTPFPALTVLSVGKGTAAFFAYDLPAAVAKIRQGNPDLAGSMVFGLWKDHPRPTDLFLGHLDTAKGHIPQADVHCNLLSNLIHFMSPCPLPRLWYYPEPDQRSVLIMNSDDDWSSPDQFEELRSAVEAQGGRVTFYLVEDTKLPRDKVKEWSDMGHSFSIHPTPPAEDSYWEMEGVLRRHLSRFRESYGIVPGTIRFHACFWKGFTDGAKMLARQGFAMDFNLLSIGNFWGLYVNGSGRPMKFVDEDGNIIDLFQQLTIFYDDASVMGRLKNEADAEIERAVKVLEESVKLYHTPFGFQSHPVSFATYSSRYVKGVLASARRMGVPILSSEEWANFTLFRYSAGFENISFTGGRLDFTLAVARPGAKLTVMVPLKDEYRIGKIRVNGEETDFFERRIHGHRYAMIPVGFEAGAAKKALSVELSRCAG